MTEESDEASEPVFFMLARKHVADGGVGEDVGIHGVSGQPRAIASVRDGDVEAPQGHEDASVTGEAGEKASR